MRARYSAYATANLDYVWASWHPRTRPADLDAEDGVDWVSVQIVDTAAGRAGDDAGEVEFIARHRDGVLHERSRFRVRAGRWFYVDGDLLA